MFNVDLLIKILGHSVFKCSTPKDNQLEKSNGTYCYFRNNFFASKDFDHFSE